MDPRTIFQFMPACPCSIVIAHSKTWVLNGKDAGSDCLCMCVIPTIAIVSVSGDVIRIGVARLAVLLRWMMLMPSPMRCSMSSCCSAVGSKPPLSGLLDCGSHSGAHLARGTN